MTDVRITSDMSNPVWRINTLYRVRDDEGRDVPFRLRPEQLDLLKNLHSRNLILKSRQLGFSTLVSLLQLDQAIFNSNFAAATICDTLPNATKMFRNKVKFPYESMPAAIQREATLTIQNTNEFVFGNGSSISIGVSARSDTLQSLHISEFGKIASHYPDKALEIMTGSLEAVTLSTGLVFIESTAEGEGNEFHRLAMQALSLVRRKKPLTALDFKLHFYPWFLKPTNRLDPAGVAIGGEDMTYFAKVTQRTGAQIDPKQMAWYVKKKEELGSHIKREHPSWPEEAFESPVEGAILAHEMGLLDKMQRIGVFPWVPQLPVHTFWDIKGTTAIWCMQRVRGMNRMIHYMEDVNMGFEYFVNKLNGLGYTWGLHHLPHDGRSRVQGQHVETPQDIIERLGWRRPEIVPRVSTKTLGIQVLRSFLLTCELDEQGCKDGIKALRNYRRKWDDKKGSYSDEPMDDWASHGTDAIRQAAQANEIPSHETAPWQPMTINGPMPRGNVVDYGVLDADVGF